MTNRTQHGPRHSTPNYTVRVRGEAGCMMTSRPELIPGQVDCYLSSRPGGIVDVFYGECCAACGGRGDVPKRGRVMFAQKPCRRCAGTGGIVADAPVTL